MFAATSQTAGQSDLAFTTGGSEKMRISYTGYVGINVTSPGSIYRLNVNGTGLFQSGLVVNGNLSSVAVNIASTASYLLAMTNSSGGVSNQNKYLRINASGTLEWVSSNGGSTIMSLSDGGLLTTAAGVTVGTDLYVGNKVISPLPVYFNNVYSQPHVTFDAPGVQYRFISYNTNGSIRWQVGVDNSAETGSNAGSNFFINALNDVGGYINTPFTINRSSGQSYFTSELTVSSLGTYGSGQLRMIYGNYGAMWRNDGSNIYLLFTNSGDQYGAWNSLRPFYASVTTGLVTLGNGLNVTGAITATGEITAYASDGRLKGNVETISNAMDRVMSISGVTFDWLPEVADLGFIPVKTHDVGVIAQDVERVLPEAVRPAPFDLNEERTGSKSGENYLTVQYEKLTALLIEAVKELNGRIVSLEDELRDLRG
jgi:hypothetical protein